MTAYATIDWINPVAIQVEDAIFETVVTAVGGDAPTARDIVALVAWGYREGFVECTDVEAL